MTDLRGAMQLKMMMITNDLSPSRRLRNLFNFYLKKVKLNVQKDEIDGKSKNYLKSPHQQIRFFFCKLETLQLTKISV